MFPSQMAEASFPAEEIVLHVHDDQSGAVDLRSLHCCSHRFLLAMMLRPVSTFELRSYDNGTTAMRKSDVVGVDTWPMPVVSSSSTTSPGANSRRAPSLVWMAARPDRTIANWRRGAGGSAHSPTPSGCWRKARLGPG